MVWAAAEYAFVTKKADSYATRRAKKSWIIGREKTKDVRRKVRRCQSDVWYRDEALCVGVLM